MKRLLIILFLLTSTSPLFSQVQGLSNEGREFFLGMIYPSYYTNDFINNVSTYLKAYSFITSYYDNDIFVAYYDEAGVEGGQSYHIAAKSSIRIQLDIQKMRIDSSHSGQAVNKSCHITSRLPITVQYLSTGGCSGGSYLALPVLGLGKNYVAACYNDNPINGAFFGPESAVNTHEYASGIFIIIATENETNVKITPATTTTDNHIGVNTGTGSNGTPHPYSITLNKGQCYLVRSSGRDESADLSGSLIESSKPIAVISGHENAFLGSIEDYKKFGTVEGRDLMIEQMIPVELWDSVGFVSIPLAEATPPADHGHGDSYRVYAFDSLTAKAHADVQGIGGGYDMWTRRFTSPTPERFDIISPIDIYTTDGRKISVIQYDERSQSTNMPLPTPSMMTVIPVSRWKSSYNFAIPDFEDPKIIDAPYIQILSTNVEKIFYSLNGATPKQLSSLSAAGSFNSVSTHYNIKGVRYKIGSGSYRFFSEFPFAMYNYSMRELGIFPQYLGFHDDTDLNFEYASHSGLKLSTGVQTSFSIDTTTKCSSWHICIRDTSKINPGIKAIMLLDDPDGIYFNTPGKYNNVSFEAISQDLVSGELHPNNIGNALYCFDLDVTNPLQSANAPIIFIDNNGNASILNLKYSPPFLTLSTNPPTAKPDSIVFPVKKIGEEICTTFVVKNTAPKGGTALLITSALLTGKEASYSVKSVIPSLPVSLAAQDSVILQVCYTPSDSSRHRDTLKVSTDCFSFSVSLDAHGSTGLISASDLDFGSIYAGDTTCKDILIKNVGSAPFTVTKSFVLSDSVNFSVNSALPKLIPIGATVTVNICFHPKTEGPFTAGIDWGTDLEASFAHSIKSHSTVSGIANPKLGVKIGKENSFSIYPNPSNGNSVIVTFGNGFSGTDFSPSGKDGRTEVRPTGDGKATLSIFDVLGREVYHESIPAGLSRMEIPVTSLPEGTYYVRIGSKIESFVKVK